MFFLNVGAEAFDQTAGDDQALGFAGLLEFGHFENRVYGFLFGGIDEAAGVDDDNVGVGGLRGKFVAICDELTHHDFCVNQVLRTAETYKSDFQSGVRS